MADGHLFLIDFGGSLGPRARGKHKAGTSYSPAIGVFESKRNLELIYDTFLIKDPDHPWNRLTRDDAIQVVTLFQTLTDEKLTLIVQSAQYSKTQDTAYMIQA